MLDSSIFHAYDIRGKYPDELDEDSAFKIGLALSRIFRSGKIILGHGSRISSPRLYHFLIKGFRKNKKLQLIRAGLITTPMLTFLVNQFKARGGVVVTASHNPKKYSGFKIVQERAVPLSGYEVYKLIRRP